MLRLPTCSNTPMGQPRGASLHPMGPWGLSKEEGEQKMLLLQDLKNQTCLYLSQGSGFQATFPHMLLGPQLTSALSLFPSWKRGSCSSPDASEMPAEAQPACQALVAPSGWGCRDGGEITKLLTIRTFLHPGLWVGRVPGAIASSASLSLSEYGW